ncbi:MAG: ROK family protein [Actinobacteria bacterium]|nr:ROK family protein [Actinomycetota bacterium]
MAVDRGTPVWLRTVNDRTAFRLLLEHGPLSRSQLGELSGMSKPTAGQMIQRLERLGLIAPMGETAGARGPHAVAYGVRTDSLTGVAISILADRIEAVLVDPTDADHPVATIPTTGERSPAADVLGAAAAACAAAGVSQESVSVVVVGVQAAVDADVDRLSFTDTLPGWPETGARGHLEQVTGMAVILDNDVNLATMAERAAGSAGEVSDFVHLWLGQGLGAGVDIGGVLQHGASGSAGEIGYLEVPRSAIAIDPEATDYTDLLGEQAVRALLGGADLTAALSRLPGNEPALVSLAERVAPLIQLLAAVLDPACVVLGGPTGVAGGKRLAALVQERIDDRLPIRPSRAGGQAVLLGARRLLVESIRTRLEDRIKEN